jgi:hypothetical protein
MSGLVTSCRREASVERWLGVALIAIGLTVAAGCGNSVDPGYVPPKVTGLGAPAAPLFTITGPPETVFNWSTMRCEDLDIPDLPARAFRNSAGDVQLVAAHYINRRMIGPSLGTLTHPCDVVMRSSRNPDPSKYDDYEWLASFYTQDGTNIYALVHNEYHGIEHDPHCTGGVVACWWNAVTLATSSNGGATFDHSRAPSHLVAAIPYPYAANMGPAGLFRPSNIVFKDGHYYALMQLVNPYDADPVARQGTCIMRTDNLADPAAWRGWDGSGFNLTFINPSLRPNDPPLAHLCTEISHPEIQDLGESLTFNSRLDRWIVVGLASKWNPGTNKTDWGFYYSLSTDLINWTDRELLMSGTPPWEYSCGAADPVAYPSLIDPDSSSRNFETTGKTMYIYFTQFHNHCAEPLNRDLIRVPVEISG